MAKEMFIYAYRSGQIKIWRKVPKGALPIAKGPWLKLSRWVEGPARLAKDNETWLVPGVPEAEGDGQAYEAFVKWLDWCRDGMIKAGLTPMFRKAA